jgi:beta-glucanase (GH16 family)
LIALLGLLVVFGVAACDPTTTTTTTSATTTQTTTTTSESTTTTTTTTTTTSAASLSLTDRIPAECAELEIVDGWIPVWCDEFETSYPTTILDPAKWVFEQGTGNGGWGNNEAQYYTYRDQDNAKVEDGLFKIIALRENMGGMEYTSSRVRTRPGNEWTYGKFVMRAKMPAGRGTWSAFWMMPRTSAYGGWPRSGEIDIMEYVGYDVNRVYGTIHTERYFGGNARGGSRLSLISLETEFHEYSAVWEPGRIEWFFNGVSYNVETYDPNFNYSFRDAVNVDWPFDQPFYFILNLAIGGNWGGAQGIDNTIFPTTYEIDYVRVYQQDLAYGDNESPSLPKTVRTLLREGTTAYITWQASTDNRAVRQYLIFVDGNYVKATSVWGVQLTNLTPGTDHLVSIMAEDFAGNLSESFDLIVNIPIS